MNAYIEDRGGRCEACAGSFVSEIFHFHHKDPSTKEFELSINNWESAVEAKIEANKCALLCPTCHALEHYYLRRGESILK